MFLTSEPTVTLEDSNVSIGTRQTIEDIQPVFPFLAGPKGQLCMSNTDYLSGCERFPQISS